MSGIFSERSSDNVASVTETVSSSRVSSCAVKEMMVTEHCHDQGLLAAICEKLLCRRGHHDDDDSAEACRVQSGGLCSLCCGAFYPCRSERRHCTVLSSSKQVHCLPSSLGRLEVTTRQPGTIGRCNQHRCTCVADFITATSSCEAAGISRTTLANDTLRRHESRHSDSLPRSSKQTATMRRVMLADAAYGHATVLDDCMLSDSDAWSGSLSLSRPNSGTNSLERGVTGTSTVQENADEVYESYSDEGEVEDDAVWPAVITLPALPVYDQVKDSGAGWSLASELRRLVHYGWYWGPITRVEAEEKLAGQEDGTFLVRDSSDDHYLLSLSFRSFGRTLHTRIEHCQGSFSLYSQSGSDGYQSIVELIERSVDDSKTGVFCYSRARALGSPSFPVRLTRAVSRFSQVRTLQYLCRFVIRQHTRVDHIQRLPLPTSIKGWLEERPY